MRVVGKNAHSIIYLMAEVCHNLITNYSLNYAAVGLDKQKQKQNKNKLRKHRNWANFCLLQDQLLVFLICIQVYLKYILRQDIII